MAIVDWLKLGMRKTIGEKTLELTAGVLYAATLALCMDLTDPQAPATHFQLFMALLNLRSMWASWLGGRLAERTPPLFLFTLGAAIELLPLVLLLALAPRRRPPGELPSTREAEERHPR